MRNKIIKGFCLMGLFFLLACEKTDPDPINVVSVDQEFEVFPAQRINENGSQFYITVRTAEVQACSNSVLDAEMSIANNSIEIIIHGLTEAEDCDGIMDYVERSFEIPNTVMDYDISFFIGELASTSGQLSVSASGISMDIDNLGGIYIMASNLIKIQDDFFWGFFTKKEGLMPNVQELPLEEVRDDLVYSIGRMEMLEAGQYDFFEVFDDGSVIVDGMKPEALGMAFEIDSPDLNQNWDKLKFHLDNIGENRNDFNFMFFNARGESHDNFD